MENEKQPGLDNWNDYAGDYIKAEFISKFPAKLVVIAVKSVFEQGKAKLLCQVEYSGREWTFDLNKTNQNVIRATDLMPFELVGKVFTVASVKVTNPSTKQLVDSLVITHVE